jgi:hypothetical protein
MVWWMMAMAWARPVPVSGWLSDGDGAPLEGTHAARVRLLTASVPGGVAHDETANLAFSDGAFAVLLDVSADVTALAAPDLAVELTVDGATSAPVPVGWDLRSAFAAAAADSAALGGLARDGFLEETEPLAPLLSGESLTLGAATTVGGDTVATDAELAAQLATTAFSNAARAAVSGAAISLNAGSTLGGTTFSSVARAAVSGSAIDLNAASTLGGATFGAVARSAVSGSAIDLNPASTLGGSAFSAVARAAVSGSAIDLAAASTLGGVPFGTAARAAVSGAAIDLAAGSTIGGQPFGSGSSGLSASSALRLYTSKAAAQADGLVHWFPLDSTSAAALNDAVNTATFTPLGAVPTPGVRGLAWDRGTAVASGFRATLPQTYNTFTVSFWWRIDDPTVHSASDGAGIFWASGAIADAGTRAISYNNTDMSLALRWRGWAMSSNNPSGARVVAGEWIHYVLTVNNNTQSTLYLNGAATSSDTSFNWILGPNVWFANYSEHGGNTNNHYSRGTLDEVAVWNRPLTAAEVGALYTQILAGKAMF